MKFLINKRTSSKRLIKKANSRQSVSGYMMSSYGATLLPDFSFDMVLNLVDNDPVARGAIQHFVDKCIEGEWAIVDKKTKKYDQSTEDSLRYDQQFEGRVLRRLYKVAKLFNNVFLEIVRKDNDVTPTDFNILDSTNIDPNTKANGDAISYKTSVPNPATGEYGEWKANDIVWMKFNSTDNGWAPVDIKALYTVLLQKRYINRFVSWAWQTGQYRVVHNLKTADDTVIQDFIAYNNKVDGDFTKPFLAGGDYMHGLLRDMKEIESLTEYLKFLDNQILVLLRIPPIDAGIPDASGRSNADAQSNNLNTHIKSMKVVVADGINELFKKINKGNSIIVFGPTDRFEEQMIISNVQSLKSVGFTDAAVREYLFDKGMVWGAKRLFEANEDPKSGNRYDNPRDLDQYDSRKGLDAGEASAKIGTGYQSSTREGQLIKKSRYFGTNEFGED